MAIDVPVLSSNHEGADGWIETFNTNFVHYIGQNDPKHFDIEDIAHSLGQIPRFNGHCVKSYKVGHHSCIVCDLAPEEFKLEALMHDSAEAYTGDITRPLKYLVPDLKTIEEWLLQQIFNHFGIDFPYHDSIDIIDSRLLLDEGNQLFKEPVHWRVGNLTPIGYKFDVNKLWDEERAEKEFLDRFYKYWKLKK